MNLNIIYMIKIYLFLKKKFFFLFGFFLYVIIVRIFELKEDYFLCGRIGFRIIYMNKG